MSVFLPNEVECSCGAKFKVDAAESVNVGRAPHLREQIIRGDFHGASCPACKRAGTIETPFVYRDPGRHLFFNVQPRNARHLWKSAIDSLNDAVAAIPPLAAPGSPANLRVVFGLDELREKLLAQDANLDDRVVETLKLFVAHQHPVLLDRPRLRLSLDAHSSSELSFAAAYEHHPDAFKVRVPRDAASRVTERCDEMRAWLDHTHPANGFYDEGAKWVNLWRFSPQPDALNELQRYGDLVEGHRKVGLRTDRFLKMLARLPHGNQLPDWAKSILESLFNLAKAEHDKETERKIFQHLFDVKLADDWARSQDRDDIGSLMRVFKELPPGILDGKSKLRRIDYGRADGSFYSGQNGEIFMASADTKAKAPGHFEFTVRHEIGHSVQEKLGEKVDKWLADRFGWATFHVTRTDVGINHWIAKMGGWEKLAKSTPKQRAEVAAQLRRAVGTVDDTRWGPAAKPLALPKNHPWNDKEFTPRLALGASGSGADRNCWFDDFEKWPRRGDQCFCVNFYYRTLMVVSSKTIETFKALPRRYAAMSPAEFFAEMFAVVYGPEGERRAALGDDIVDWFARYVGPPPEAPARVAKQTASRSH